MSARSIVQKYIRMFGQSSSVERALRHMGETGGGIPQAQLRLHHFRG